MNIILSIIAVTGLVLLSAWFIFKVATALIKGLVSLLVLKNLILVIACLLSFFVILGSTGFTFTGILLGGMAVGLITALFTRITAKN